MSTQDATLANLESDLHRLLVAYLSIEVELKTEAAAARKQESTNLSDVNSHAEELDAEPSDSDADELFDFDAIGWVPRLKTVDGIPEGRLGPLHGKLIALGLLKFQLTGRTSGILYRISPDGRAELRRPSIKDQPLDWVEQSAA